LRKIEDKRLKEIERGKIEGKRLMRKD